MISERTFTKNEVTFISDLPKKHTTGNKTKPLGFQKVKPKNGQPRVKGVGYFVMPSKIGKCQFQQVLLHPKE